MSCNSKSSAACALGLFGTWLGRIWSRMLCQEAKWPVSHIRCAEAETQRLWLAGCRLCGWNVIAASPEAVTRNPISLEYAVGEPRRLDLHLMQTLVPQRAFPERSAAQRTWRPREDLQVSARTRRDLGCGTSRTFFESSLKPLSPRRSSLYRYTLVLR